MKYPASAKLENVTASVMTRRRWIGLANTLCLTAAVAPWHARADSKVAAREYHVCLSAQAVLEDPDLPDLLMRAGVSCVWLAGFFYGHWPWPMETLRRAAEVLRRKGLDVRVVTIPLGHPGDSLGAKDGNFPLTPPAHWQLARDRDGKTYAGTSLHAPATDENVAALHRLRAGGFSQFFLDDDFRLARGPGEIGGCFCEAHQARFLQRTGFSESRWPELLGDIRSRRLTPLLRDWVEFACDELTGSFRAQERAANGALGIMIMYLGAEKAGIRLRDYRHVPFRVGELMFDDGSFNPVKGKTDELFSVLFHRRTVRPELAWSETTAYPSDRLSASNMAAKLVISTMADVRHTTFMSGMTPFPKAHWQTLAGEMKRQAQFHATLSGHRLQGPLKHYWGERSRYTGDDRPFSLFLATGIPFEVTEQPATDGWTFLSDADAAAVADGALRSEGTRFLSRAPGRIPDTMERCDETLEALLAFKHRIKPGLRQVPFVENDTPALLAWYPTARTALLWNVSGEQTTFQIRCGPQRREISLRSLESAMVSDLQAM